MSLVTRCPACGTAFKVVRDQLRISDGWVRCGRCSEVFDAMPGLVEAPASVMVWRSSFQSAWSEITSGSSTPDCRARCLTLIQPEATASTGSGNRRDQRSLMADGGAMTTCPASSALGTSSDGRNSPSAMPRST